MAVNLHDLIDIDLLAYFKSKLDLLFAGKVDKETGKGLSTNDYTDADKLKLSGVDTGAQVNVLEGVQVAGSSVVPTNKIANISPATQSAAGVMSATDKTKLDGVASGAQANVIEAVKKNGTALTVTDKTVDISVPTTVAELSDASSYATKDSVYTKTEIDQKLVGAMNYKGTKATTSALPSTGNSKGDVWHVTADGSEWAWNGSSWEELGTAVDLSGYVEESDLGIATINDIDDLFV